MNVKYAEANLILYVDFGIDIDRMQDNPRITPTYIYTILEQYGYIYNGTMWHLKALPLYLAQYYIKKHEDR